MTGPAETSGGRAAERLGSAPRGRTAEPAGGDPACWLDRVCPECGRFAEDDGGDGRCPSCGAELAAR